MYLINVTFHRWINTSIPPEFSFRHVGNIRLRIDQMTHDEVVIKKIIEIIITINIIAETNIIFFYNAVSVATIPSARH